MSQVFGKDPGFDRGKPIEPVTAESVASKPIVAFIVPTLWPAQTPGGTALKELQRLCMDGKPEDGEYGCMGRGGSMCEDCPPEGAVVSTRCLACPRHQTTATSYATEEELQAMVRAPTLAAVEQYIVATTDLLSPYIENRLRAFAKWHDQRIDEARPHAQELLDQCTTFTSPATAMADYIAAGSTPMVLCCPVCNGRHIDEPNPAIGWLNPPHRTHLCNHCGHLWRPQEYHTVGVSDEDWLAFMASLEEADWKAALTMANEEIKAKAGDIAVGELLADGFVKIGTQMPLYARFFQEPADQVDHIRLWYVSPDGRHMQGDSIAWTTFLTSLLTCMKVPAELQEKIVADLRGFSDRKTSPSVWDDKP